MQLVRLLTVMAFISLWLSGFFCFSFASDEHGVAHDATNQSHFASRYAQPQVCSAEAGRPLLQRGIACLAQQAYRNAFTAFHTASAHLNEAKCWLGVMLIDKQLTASERVIARDQLDCAVAQGDIYAKAIKGLILVGTHPQEARTLWQESQDLLVSQYNLGVLAAHEGNIIQALERFSIAGAHGDDRSQSAIISVFDQNELLQYSHRIDMSDYRSASDQEDSEANLSVTMPAGPRAAEVKRPAKPYVCDICNKAYKLIGSLKRHKEQRHDPAFKRLSCPFCPQTFARRDYLLEHRRHCQLPNKPYSCVWCGKSFKRSKRHRVHERSCLIARGLVESEDL